MVNASRLALDPIRHRAPNSVPHTRMLAVIETALPAPSVMQVMIFNNTLYIKPFVQPAQWRRRGRIDSQSAMSQDLQEDQAGTDDTSTTCKSPWAIRTHS
ncbi:hypothetical protein J3459_002608 [Metarhizium acridum]|nr:hypothetical protein J3459_002608 [Metarhizium acridum]